VNYRPIKDVLVYGTFKQGYRGPALNSQVASSPLEFSAVKPETLNAFEVGAKTQLTDWLRLNLAAFHYDYNKQQYFGQVPVLGGFISQLSNVGTTRIKGIDWLVEAVPGTHYFEAGFETAGSFGFDELYRGAPRTFGGDVTFNF
jgi:outer membrane receptor protein involved in Fe transport